MSSHQSTYRSRCCALQIHPHEIVLSNVAYPVFMTVLLLPIVATIVMFGRKRDTHALSPAVDGRAVAEQSPTTESEGESGHVGVTCINSSTTQMAALVPEPVLAAPVHNLPGTACKGASKQRTGIAGFLDAQRQALADTPFRAFAAVAFTAQLQNLLVSLPAAEVPGSLQVLLSTMSVPVTMLVSYLWFNARYQLTHFLGAFVVVCGILVAVWRDLSAATPGGKSAGMDQVLWILVFLAGVCVPVGVVTERYIKDTGLNVVVFRACYSPFEILMSCVLLPVMFVPLPGQPARVAPSEFVTYLHEGFRCFGGFETDTLPGTCSGMATLFAVDLCVNLSWLALGLAIMRYASAAVQALALAAAIPVSTFAFDNSWIAGIAVQHNLSWWTVTSMVIVMGGFLVYRRHAETYAGHTPWEAPAPLAAAGVEDGSGSQRRPLHGPDPGRRANDRTPLIS